MKTYSISWLYFLFMSLLLQTCCVMCYVHLSFCLFVCLSGCLVCLAVYSYLKISFALLRNTCNFCYYFVNVFLTWIELSWKFIIHSLFQKSTTPWHSVAFLYLFLVGPSTYKITSECLTQTMEAQTIHKHTHPLYMWTPNTSTSNWICLILITLDCCDPSIWPTYSTIHLG